MSTTPKRYGIDLAAVVKAIEESQTNLDAMTAAYTKMLHADLAAVARATEQTRINLEAMGTAYTKLLRTDLEAVAGAFEQSRISLEAMDAAYTKIPRIDLDAVGRAFEQTHIRLEPMTAAYAEIPRIDLDSVGRSLGKNFGIDPDAMKTALEQVRIDLSREPFGADFGIDLDAMQTSFDKNFGVNLEALRQSVAAAYGRHPSDLKSPRERPVHDLGGTDVEELGASSASPSTAPDQAQVAKSATAWRIATAWQYLGTLSLIDDLLLGGTAKSALRETVVQSVIRITVEFLTVLSLLTPAPPPSSSLIPTGHRPEAKNETAHIVDRAVPKRDIVSEVLIPPREKDR